MWNERFKYVLKKALKHFVSKNFYTHFPCLDTVSLYIFFLSFNIPRIVCNHTGVTFFTCMIWRSPIRLLKQACEELLSNPVWDPEYGVRNKSGMFTLVVFRI